MPINSTSAPNIPIQQPSTTSPGNPFDIVKERTAYDAYEAVLKNPDATNPFTGKGKPNNESAWNRGAEEARNFRDLRGAITQGVAAKAVSGVQDIQTPLPGSSTPPSPNPGVSGPK